MGTFFKDRFTVIIILFLISVSVFPYTELITEMLIFGLLAVSFNLMFGYTGLLSFGHAALFSIGAYTMGLLLVRFEVNIFLGMLAGSILTAMIAMIIGWVSIRLSGVYFAMLTLAFNEVVYFSILQWKNVTGGDDGLRGIFRPNMDLGLFSLSLQRPREFFFFVLFFFILSILAIRRIICSPFGSVLLAIRENENRTESIGYNPRDYKIVVFMISGFFAGLAGSLFSIQIKYAALSFCHWSQSGEVLIMALVGGTGSLYGPILGAVLVTLMRSVFSVVWDRWLLLLGMVFVGFIMFLRGGVWEGLESGFSYLARHFKRKKISREIALDQSKEVSHGFGDNS